MAKIPRQTNVFDPIVLLRKLEEHRKGVVGTTIINTDNFQSSGRTEHVAQLIKQDGQVLGFVVGGNDDGNGGRFSSSFGKLVARHFEYWLLRSSVMASLHARRPSTARLLWPYMWRGRITGNQEGSAAA
jgi:hypothetical protein